MSKHIWAVFTTRYSWKTFAFVHTVELIALLWFGTIFYGATLIYSLLRWP